ncbi:MAG: ABC transporter ATP-binding protein [Bacilli bacterium]|nr:ABC transporter ATP-binding protein [Bacilli bacterium]
MIKIENLHKYFKKTHVINNININLEDNGLVILKGKSGSGKTTLLNMIAGLINQSSGNIYIDNELITQKNKDKIRTTKISYIYQDFKLINSMTVFDNIALPLKILGIKNIEEKVDNILEKLEITNYRNYLPCDLSGGQKQKVAIARALVKDSNIILADEITSNQDNKNAKLIMDIIKEISKDKLIILVTHDIDIIKYASHIITLNKGTIKEDIKYTNTINNINRKSIDYKSIYKFKDTLIKSFKKVSKYPILKKLLLTIFFISSIFIMYSISNIYSLTNIKDSNFVLYNHNYLLLNDKKIKINDILKFEKLDSIKYIIPTDSIIDIKLINNNTYQSSTENINLKASLASIDLVKDLSYGRMPTNNKEVVIDKMVFINNYNEIENPIKYMGYKDITSILDNYIEINNILYKIVGITNYNSPSIYTKETEFYNILNKSNIVSYELYKDKIKLVSGNIPCNDYEIIINENDYNYYNDKFKVVGYYKGNINYYLALNNTIKYNLIEENNTFSIISKNNNIYNDLKDYNLKNSYKETLKEYKKINNKTITKNIKMSLIILSISSVIIYLISKMSILSKTNEIETKRIIGVKKSDIYKIFISEILAITTIYNIPGVVISAYILKTFSKISYLSNYITINCITIITTILLLYTLNIIIVSLLIYNVLKKDFSNILCTNLD